MSTRGFLPQPIFDYLLNVSLRDTPIQRSLREETARLPNAGMQTGADQVQFLQLLVHLVGAKRCLEVGVFTGYSALGVALALPEDGCIVACDVSEAYTAIGRRYWEQANVARKIDLRVGPALATLDEMLSAGEAGRYDFAYIDADKSAYDTYYERCLQLLRPNGVIAIDNVLWSGAVAEPAGDDADTAALQALNRKIGKDERVEACMLSIGDGLTLARKR